MNRSVVTASLQRMVLAPLLAAPAVMFVATAAERRFGAAVAGLVGAAPVALAVVILSVGDGAVAASAAAHVIAQVAFAVAFALVVVHRGGVVGALAGVAAYAVSPPHRVRARRGRDGGRAPGPGARAAPAPGAPA